MNLKSKIEAIIYAAEEPVSIEQIAVALKEELAAGEDSGNKESAKEKVRAAVEELIAAYATDERGIEVRKIGGGYRMSTKPEHHDAVRAFAKSLKPPIRLSLPALETLAVIAYKQPITAPEIAEIRGVDTSGVLATLIDRKLITTAGRKAVVGRPILYKTTKDFLLRFGLSDLNEMPSVEEFEKMASESLHQQGLFAEVSIPDATGIPDLEPESQASENSQAQAAAESEDENSKNGQAAEKNETPNELHGLKPDTL
ncbi:MAG TPA: SMC-Scp complex subunit ScpB [Candidatus Angelobacter sp.]|nr:SMC-Scp complex subunit ScpB [Candidatus Angelobacter sp.]